MSTEMASYGGDWSPWSGWSDCSLSCSGGFQQRTRVCESTGLLCLGVSEQVLRCNTGLCPLPDLTSVWTTWGAWSLCTHSCGSGTQLRERVCRSVTDDSIVMDDCVGDVIQERQCNDFACPDCSYNCSEGVLDSRCAYCQCSEAINGQILSNAYLPLSNATISPTMAPYITVATSGTGGHFTAEGVCLGAMYEFRKSGYIDKHIIFAEHSSNITMERVVSLQMVRNPTDVMGLAGQRITLCCESSGNPPPDYYEWMKDDILIESERSPGSSTLTIDSASLSDTGYYTCRASNDYSAIFSSVATVLVKETADEFCSSHPQSNVVSLPEGCLYRNSTVIDKGSCDSNPCYGVQNIDCAASSNHCCGPTGLSRVLVDCEEYWLPVYLVTSCGCTACRQPQLNIYGFAGSRDGVPLQYGDIYWNGSLITNTSFDGTFSFTINRGVSRASILFVDTVNATFMDSTYVFATPTDDVESHYVRVYLLRRGQTNQLNASAENTLVVDSASIDIPPDSFYTTDGLPYEGEVTASVTTIDPSNIEELASAPGDFSMIDEEGENQPLVSYGMFALLFQDNNGNRLSIPGEITITISSDSLGNITDDSDIKMWTLNPDTGLWVFESDLVSNDARKKRQIRPNAFGRRRFSATIRGISIDTRWYNFDAISSQTCVVKVRLFYSNNFNELEQLPNGKVFVVLQDSSGYNSLSTKRVSSDRGNSNGYCMVLPCASSRSRQAERFRGYIFADYNDEPLIPAQTSGRLGLENSDFDLESELNYEIHGNKINVDFNERLVHNERHGAFYDWERKWRYSSTCSNAEFDQNHFRFSKNADTLIETNTYDVIPSDPYESNQLNLLLWNDLYTYFPNLSPNDPRPWIFQTCFVKILAPANTRIQATSYVGDNSHPFYNDVYGVREDLAVSGAVCLEVRRPGNPRESITDNGFTEERTRISIRTLERIYYVKEISSHLTDIYEEDVLTTLDSVHFEINLVENRAYGFNYGLYCAQGNAPSVKQQAMYMCRNGNGSAAPNTYTTLDSWAVRFGTENGLLNLVFVIDNQWRFFTTSDKNDILQFVESVTDTLRLAVDSVLVSIVGYGYTRFGNLRVSVSQENLLDRINRWISHYYHRRNWPVYVTRALNYDYLPSHYHSLYDYDDYDLSDWEARIDAPAVVVVISGGYDTRYANACVNTVESRARVLLVGTRTANWNNLNQFNSNPNDRFDVTQADEVIAIIHSII